MKLQLVVLALFSFLLTTALAEERTAKRIAPVTAPPAPQTLEQMPAVPPQVTYQGGQLTITARNSTLGDILKGVHAQTGAEIDLPGPGNDRVVGTFGPGPARDVLAALLYGSHFNYVLLGSETDPQSLNRVMLFVKTSASETPEETASAAAYQGNGAPANQNMARPFAGRPGMPVPNAANQQPADAADAEADDDSSDADDQTDDQADDQSADAETVQGEEPAQVKSPEQMLQELQQQQQQQQSQPGTQPGFPSGIRPGFPPGMQPGMPGTYPPGVTPPNQGPEHN